MSGAILTTLIVLASLERGVHDYKAEYQGSILQHATGQLRGPDAAVVEEQAAIAPDSPAKGYVYEVPQADNAGPVDGIVGDWRATPSPEARAPEPTPRPVVREQAPVAPVDVVALICSYPWPCQQALSVAYCESHYLVTAYNAGNYGIFQLNAVHVSRVGGKGNEYLLWVAEINVRVAYEIWRDNAGWGPWACKPVLGRLNRSSDDLRGALAILVAVPAL